MAREKGSFEFSANLQIKKGAALDPRTVVDTKAELINKETWPYDGDIIYLYNGLVVSVLEENSQYQLIDLDNFSAEDYSAWKKIGEDKTTLEEVDAIYLKKEDATGENITLSSSYVPAVYPEDTGDGEFSSLVSGETLDSAIKKIDQNLANVVEEILDNEEVMAQALTDLNETKTTLSEVDSIYLRKENLPTSLKNPYKLTIKKNNSTLADYDGSSSKLVNLSFNSEEITIGSNYNTVEYSGNISFDPISSGETLSTSLNSLENNISNLAGKIADNEAVVAASLVDLNERVNSKQDILVSGENIKTIGGQSIVGPGNIDIDFSNLVDLTSNQTISGEKKFTNTINIADKTDIAVNIDSGELKVFHHDPNNAEGKQNKGFILRSKINENEEIPSVELLGTNGDASYQYNFPKTNGNVALGAKINGKVHSASLEDGLISFEIGDYISATDITHGELLELKNNKQLKPGQPYRIIDYITTTNGRENSSSANHKFDLIVEALTTDQLSESAKACHAKYLNEEYSYDITNPLCGHTIAVANWGGVGINDIPNGIKNLPFTAEDGDDVRSVTVASYKQSAITCNEGSIKVIWQWQNGEGHTKKINILGVELIDASDNRIVSSDYHIGSTGTTNNSNIYTVAAPKTGTYKFKYYIDGKTEEVNSSCTVYAYPVRDYFENSNLSAWEIGYNIENNVDKYRWAQTNGTGKGVIYYMKDEFCNEATYDFKNIKYNDKYTFSYTINNVLYDGSVKYGSYCHHNVVGPDMIVGGTQFKGLSKIYFLNTAANAECNNNIIYNNCWDIQFGSGCYGNKIGVGCEQIYLGDNCSLNTFGDGTQKITLGSNSIQNHFGEKCYNCKISSDSSGNSALTHVKNVSFGNECNGVILWTSNTNTSDYLQNYKLGNSLTGSIEISGENTRGRSYTTEINFNTSGEIKQFYLSEITQVKEDLNTLSDVVSGEQENIDNLTSILTQTEDPTAQEISFRPSGGDTSIEDGTARIERVKGSTLVWNQFAPVDLSSYILLRGSNKTYADGVLTATSTTANNTSYIYKNASEIIPSRLRRVIYGFAEIKADSTNAEIYMIGVGTKYKTATGDWQKIETFGKVSVWSGAVIGAGVRVKDELVTWSIRQLKYYDLTQMFGEGNEPTSIEEFHARKPLNIDEYAYNEGELISNNVEELKSVGFNAWDEEWEAGGYYTSTGGKDNTTTTLGDTIRNVNPIKILQNTEYELVKPAKPIWILFYDETGKKIEGMSLSAGNTSESFISPAGCSYMNFMVQLTTTYNHDICIHLVHTGSRNGEYEPYKEFRRGIPIKEIKDKDGNQLFPNGLLSAGSAHDEITATKAIKRIGVLPLRDVEFGFTANNKYYYTSGLILANNAVNNLKNTTCSHYLTKPWTGNGGFTSEYNGERKPCLALWRVSTGLDRVNIIDDSVDDAAELMAMLKEKDVMLYYELAEPIEVDLPEPLNLDYEVSDFGTEEIVSTEPTTPMKADIIYKISLIDKVNTNSLIIDHKVNRSELVNLVSNVNEKITSLIDNAPESLNTLGEIASALENNKNIVQELRTSINNKAEKTELNNYVSQSSLGDNFKTINGNSILGEGNLDIDPGITSELADSIENISDQLELSENALRKTEQALTESQKIQVRSNIQAQKELTLIVKDNGNIVIGNIQGESKEFMPATPSGDPMHYAYLAGDAEWNGTGTDIVKDAPWKTMVDNEDEKTVIHKAGCWYLHGIGDLTNEQMRRIYTKGHWNENDKYPIGYSGVGNTVVRTCFSRRGAWNATGTTSISGYNSSIETISLGIYPTTTQVYSPSYSLSGNNVNFFTNSSKLKHIYGCFIIFNSANNTSAFNLCSSLISVAIQPMQSVNFKDCPKLSYQSVKYLISNPRNTTQITLTLHPDALSNAETRYLLDTDQDLTTYPTLSDWALSKNIQIATV